jgi:hypothetical protein
MQFIDKSKVNDPNIGNYITNKGKEGLITGVKSGQK